MFGLADLILLLASVIYCLLDQLTGGRNISSSKKRESRRIQFLRDKPYCLQYTWVRNPETNKNYSCSTYKKKLPSYDCTDPVLLRQENEREPNISWLLQSTFNKAVCPLHSGYSCIKHTYRFDGQVQNVTRFCAKVAMNRKPIHSGCITSYIGSHVKELCACTTAKGMMPCNTGPVSAMAASLITLPLVFLITST